MTETWPVTIRGITESIISTPAENDDYHVSALGLNEGTPVTAITWGESRTRQNFEREGEGFVQFTRDPVAFVESSLTEHTQPDPILEGVDAWVHVEVEMLDSGSGEGAEWVQWALEPTESTVEHRVVPATNRGYAAVIEAAVAGSRLDVEAYDEHRLFARLRYFGDVIQRCGGEREQRAWRRINEILDLPELDHRFESF